VSSPVSRAATGAAPALLLAGSLFAQAVLAWPAVLGTLVSLDWHVGDMRPVARGASVVFAVLGVLVLLARKDVARRWARVFPDRRSCLLAAITFVVSLTIFAVAAGIGLRLLDLPFRTTWTPSENALARFDPELGWVYVPESSHVTPFGRERRMVPIHFDGIGARVGGPGVSRDPEAPTVIVVGGSFAFGHGLPYEETFAGRLESMAGFPYQIVNLGVQAYGTDQSLLRLQRHMQEFRTVAVVYVFIEDHVSRNANHDRRLIYPDARFLGTKPRFSLNRDGSLRLVDEPYRYGERIESNLWNWIQLAWAQNGPRPRFELTRALVREMRDHVESHGAELIVVLWRQNIEFPPGSGERTGGGGGSVLQGLGLDLIDAGFDAPPGWDDWTIAGDPHPDARAHLRVAELLARELERHGSPPAD